MKNAVIIVNLGTPREPTAKAVATFLREFLSDRRVVEVPRPIWTLILNLFIIPLRARKVAEAYAAIWGEGGSPLRSITEKQAQLLQESLRIKMGTQAPLVRVAMTYSGPAIESVVDELEAQQVDNILVLPLYPQYSATTTGSVYDQVAGLFRSRRNIPPVQVIKQYYQHPLYIEALATTVREHWQQYGRAERLLISFHSIPVRYCRLGDPYFEQCKSTAERLAQTLQLAPEQWRMTFQSRLGRAEWLSPYTIDVLTQWGEEKLGSVNVVCPAFSADCLETLEEIDVENREAFQQSGGGSFSRVPCLNTHPAHIELMASLVENYLPVEFG